jgi:hypothetical protein
VSVLRLRYPSRLAPLRSRAYPPSWNPRRRRYKFPLARGRSRVWSRMPRPHWPQLQGEGAGGHLCVVRGAGEAGQREQRSPIRGCHSGSSHIWDRLHGSDLRGSLLGRAVVICVNPGLGRPVTHRPHKAPQTRRCRDRRYGLPTAPPNAPGTHGSALPGVHVSRFT